MNGWPRFGAVGVAGIFAAIAIGLALYSTMGTSMLASQKDDALVSSAPTPKRDITDWSMLLSAIATSSSQNAASFRAAEELSTTEAITQELVATQRMIEDGTLSGADIDKALVELARRNIKPVEPKDSYVLASIKVASTSLEDYAGALRGAMENSGYVDEYELTTFARTLRLENHNGTPELQRAGSLYRSVEKQLAAMLVPSPLAPAHLEVVKSVAFMAQSVELMSEWSGDHYDALVYIDAFLRADADVQQSLEALGEAMIKFGKGT